jgi:peroxiredoxin
LAEFRHLGEEFRALNVGLAAISVDEAGHSEPLRNLYQIPFPILCDTQAEVIRAWGLFDPNEKGGISRSAVYVIDPELKVKYCSVDTTTSRIRANDLLEYLKASQGGAQAPPPERRSVTPTAGEVVRSFLPSIKESLFPKKR